MPGCPVPPGQNVALIGLVGGSGGAPVATLNGPDGRVIATPPGGWRQDAGEVVIREDTQSHETYYFINHPAAGRWTVVPQPGSPPISSIEQAAGLPDRQCAHGSARSPAGASA